jgi:hypothetical protein
MKNDRIKNDRIKSDRIKSGRIRSDRIKTDRIKRINDPYTQCILYFNILKALNFVQSLESRSPCIRSDCLALWIFAGCPRPFH